MAEKITLIDGRGVSVLLRGGGVASFSDCRSVRNSCRLAFLRDPWIRGELVSCDHGCDSSFDRSYRVVTPGSVFLQQFRRDRRWSSCTSPFFLSEWSLRFHVHAEGIR